MRIFTGLPTSFKTDVEFAECFTPARFPKKLTLPEKISGWRKGHVFRVAARREA